MVLAVSLSNIMLNRLLGKANVEDTAFVEETKLVDRVMWYDIAIKVIGFMISMIFYPSLTMIFVMLAGKIHKRRSV